jgi:hypothetical protein
MSAATRQGSTPRSGQALAEFALVIPLFLILLFAIFDLGRAVFTYNSITNAAREGARLAIVNQDIDMIKARAKGQASIAETTDPSVTVGYYEMNVDGEPDTTQPCPTPVPVGCAAVVKFESTFWPLTPMIGQIVFGNGATLRAETVLPVEFTCPSSSIPTAASCPKQP